MYRAYFIILYCDQQMHNYLTNCHTPTRVGPKVSGLTYKSRAKWKMLRGIYCAVYGEVSVSVSVCVEIKGDYIEK
jgi:hypothetical protein